MASLYKNNGIWYVSTYVKGTRISKSLKTKERKTAYSIMPSVLSNLLNESNDLNNDISFKQLADLFLNSTQHWSVNTRLLYERILNSYISGKTLPDNPTSKAIYKRHINCCRIWGIKNGLIAKANKSTGDIIGKARNRVLSNDELNMLNKGTKCPNFNSFVRLAYYTGDRSSEIRSLRRENIKDDFYAIVDGKTGHRMVKFNLQAPRVINAKKELWDYSKDFVSHKFKKECRKLGIKDARFHDLRRTFGYNLVRQGMSIFKLSKLLGQPSVRTTEKHYTAMGSTSQKVLTTNSPLLYKAKYVN